MRGCETISADLIVGLVDSPVRLTELDHVTRLSSLLVPDPLVFELHSLERNVIVQKNIMDLFHPDTLELLLVQIQLSPDDGVGGFEEGRADLGVPLDEALRPNLMARDPHREVGVTGNQRLAFGLQHRRQSRGQRRELTLTLGSRVHSDRAHVATQGRLLRRLDGRRRVAARTEQQLQRRRQDGGQEPNHTTNHGAILAFWGADYKRAGSVSVTRPRNWDEAT